MAFRSQDVGDLTEKLRPAPLRSPEVVKLLRGAWRRGHIAEQLLVGQGHRRITDGAVYLDLVTGGVGKKR